MGTNYEDSDFIDRAGKYADPDEYSKLKKAKRGKELEEAVLSESEKSTRGEMEYNSRHKEHR